MTMFLLNASHVHVIVKKKKKKNYAMFYMYV